MTEESFSLSLLAWFMHQPVQVDTPIGVFTGVLRKAAASFHMGIGCLLLETRESWMLIKSWDSIKRRT